MSLKVSNYKLDGVCHFGLSRRYLPLSRSWPLIQSNLLCEFVFHFFFFFAFPALNQCMKQ